MHLFRPLDLPQALPLAVLLAPLLCLATGCEDLREFRMEADPPIDVIRIGTDRVGRQTPFVYPLPAGMRSEPAPKDPEDWDAIFSPRYMEVLIRDSANQESLHSFRKVFRHPAERPTLLSRGNTRPKGWMGIVLPGIKTDGRIWIQGSGERLRLCSVARDNAMIVLRPLTNGQHFYDSGDPDVPMSVSGTRVQHPAPGTFVMSMPHWRIEMELPAGLSLFVDEGRGNSEFLHLTYPKDLQTTLGTENSNTTSQWIHGKNSLLAPLFLDASKWTTSLIRYQPKGATALVVSLPGERFLRLKIELRSSQRKPPPLLLALTQAQ